MVNYPTRNLTGWVCVNAVIEACVQTPSSISTRGHRTSMASPATGPDARWTRSSAERSTRVPSTTALPSHWDDAETRGFSLFQVALVDIPLTETIYTGEQCSTNGLSHPDSFSADTARRRALPGARLPPSDRVQSLSKTDRASSTSYSTNSGPRGPKPLELSSCPLRGKISRVLPSRGRRAR